MDSHNKWAFWRADNSIGTFFLENDPKEFIPPQAYDLRLAISKYGLFTVKETVPSSDHPQTRLSRTLMPIGASFRNSKNLTKFYDMCRTLAGYGKRYFMLSP